MTTTSSLLTEIIVNAQEQCHTTGLDFVKTVNVEIWDNLSRKSTPQDYGKNNPNSWIGVDSHVDSSLSSLADAVELGLENNDFILARIHSTNGDGHTISFHKQNEETFVYQSFYTKHTLKNWIHQSYHLAWNEVVLALRTKRFGIMAWPSYNTNTEMIDWASWIKFKVDSAKIQEFLIMTLSAGEIQPYSPNIGI